MVRLSFVVEAVKSINKKRGTQFDVRHRLSRKQRSMPIYIGRSKDVLRL